MKSPFPGMDPYLEDPAYWPGFHAKFINYLHESISDRLPRHYQAEIKEYIRLVDIETHRGARFEPDVNVTKNQRTPGSVAIAGELTVTPSIVELEELDEVSEWAIEVLRDSDRSVVTVVELLSPTNKGSGADDYLLKRRHLLVQRINLVEIDLLLAGLRPPLNEPWPPGDYHCLVARGSVRRKAEVHSWTVRQPIRPIPVPLEMPDPDIVVPLAEVFALTYERGRYAAKLKYRQPPRVPLSADDVQWATELGATVKIET